MNNLIHWYYQNKEKILKVLLIIAFILIIIYIINLFITNKSTIDIDNSINTSNNNLYDNNATNIYISNTTAISGENLSAEKASEVNKTISKFIEYCRDQNVEEAYNMLSDDCKEVGFKTLEQFTKEYVNPKFNKNQTYKIQLWQGKTYRIDLSEDMLATGNINDNVKNIEYITIVDQGNESKLNINNYIGKKEINKKSSQEDITITVIEKQIYIDYEIYSFKVENNTNKTIKLDSLESTGTIYLLDSNQNKYKAQMHEILESDILIREKHITEFAVKFSNQYSTRRNIRSINFSNLILDYDSYISIEDKTKFNLIYKFVINL